MKKSRAAVLLGLAVIFIFGRSDSVRAEDDSNFTNLIVFARFADEDECLIMAVLSGCHINADTMQNTAIPIR